MTIGKKIIGGYLIVLGMFVLVAAGAFYALDKVQRDYDSFIAKREALVDQASELRITVSTEIQHYRGLLLFPAEQQHYLRDLEQDDARFGSALKAIRGYVSERDFTEVNQIAALRNEHGQLLHSAIALALRGKTAEAIDFSEKELLPRARALTSLAEKFRDAQISQSNAQLVVLRQQVDRIVIVIAACTLVGLVFCVWLSLYMSRTINQQLRETITQLTSASSEILATTTQVASGAAETATAVSQTTTTVEEVKQTVQMTNQKAKQVSDTALETAQASKSGLQAVEELIDGINRIRTQTLSTADSIVRLNEQSHAIGEIIASVTDLAEQSNLLAVNAAIEAAKAGEQGKGFAVVAQEVKSLAQQSRQATLQIRTILGDIQKASDLAVMATDLNRKTVEENAKQSGTAGATIQTLSQNIEIAAQAALQITTSSQQQLVGMDQVALAMANIKEASAQNMAGTKQAEVAAQTLHDMGVRLKQLVER